MATFNLFYCTIFGGVKLTSEHSTTNNYWFSPYDENLAFINGFYGMDLMVVTRAGYEVKIQSEPPTNGSYDRIFCVRKRIQVEPRSAHSFIDSLNRIDEKEYREGASILSLKKYVRGLGQPTSAYAPGPKMDISLDIHVTYEDFIASGRCIYLQEADILIYDPNTRARELHPFSEEWLKKERVNAMKKEDYKDDFNFKIEIIDNLNKMGPRFIKVADSVHQIYSKVDHTRRSGVYVSKSSVSVGFAQSNTIEEKYYSLEEAEKELGLFRTHEEAEHSREDLKLAREEELEKMKHETSKVKEETEGIKAGNMKFKAWMQKNFNAKDAVIFVSLAIMAIVLVKRNPEAAAKAVMTAAKL